MGCNGDYCEINNYPEERNLDGCYFRVERDGKWKNICFSDLTDQEKGKVMSGKNIPWLMSLAVHMADCLHSMGDALDIYGGSEGEE